jgi:hypothetical protein
MPHVVPKICFVMTSTWVIVEVIDSIEENKLEALSNQMPVTFLSDK